MHDAYYHLIKLKLNESIMFNKSNISIDLDNTKSDDIIINDTQFKESRNLKNYFYLSGGGSFLFLNRYLMLVQRNKSTNINPGQLSLFTGRSNSKFEWLNPDLILRELFEEITMHKNGKEVYLCNDQYQSIINQTNKNHLKVKSYYNLSLKRISLSNINLKVYYKSKLKFDNDVLYHLNMNNDINILFFFNINHDPSDFNFISYDDEDSEKRQIYFVDLKDENRLFKIEDMQMKKVKNRLRYSKLCKFATEILKPSINGDN